MQIYTFEACGFWPTNLLLCNMKKFLAALGSLILFSACDNEIDINAEYKDMTIMYGMLNPVMDTNYVRIQRGYLGDDAASASYGISDSLYYDSTEIDVFIREYNPGASTFNQEVELIWDNSIPLDSGIYTDEGYHLYRIPSNFPIQSSREYEIVVNRADGSVASARTGLFIVLFGVVCFFFQVSQRLCGVRYFIIFFII